MTVVAASEQDIALPADATTSSQPSSESSSAPAADFSAPEVSEPDASAVDSVSRPPRPASPPFSSPAKEAAAGPARRMSYVASRSRSASAANNKLAAGHVGAGGSLARSMAKLVNTADVSAIMDGQQETCVENEPFCYCADC